MSKSAGWQEGQPVLISDKPQVWEVASSSLP